MSVMVIDPDMWVDKDFILSVKCPNLSQMACVLVECKKKVTL